MSALGISPQLAPGYPFDVIADGAEQDAIVRDIRSAPSLRAARLEEEERRRTRLDHPAYRARVTATGAPALTRSIPAAAPLVIDAAVTSTRREATVISVSIGKIAAYLLAFALIVGVGGWFGSQFQSTAYSGDTWSHSVQTGETLSGLAGAVATDRSLEAVMEDIRVMNNLQSDLLVPGQIVTLPSQ